jgi:hypothetical protein
MIQECTLRSVASVLVLALVLATPACTPPVPTVTVLPALFLAERGRLMVQLSRPHTRRLTATFDDVEALRLKLSGPSPVEARVPAAGLAERQGAIAIGDLAPGSYTLRLDALSESDQIIGTQSVPATVTAGVTTLIDVTLKLEPTVLPAQGGGAQIQLTIEDGDVQVGG